MRLLPFISGSFAALFLTSAHAHNRRPPPTAAEIAWARASARWDRMRRDARAFLPPRPTAPAGVTDLDFAEFFGPIGDRGLEFSEKLRALDGQRVRIVGFMVRQATPTAGVFLLAPQPAQVDELEYGACDDLPPQIVRVFVPLPPAAQVPLTAGAVILTGTLELGPRAEPDGRNSFIRLRLDSPELRRLVATPIAAVSSTSTPHSFPTALFSPP